MAMRSGLGAWLRTYPKRGARLALVATAALLGPGACGGRPPPEPRPVAPVSRLSMIELTRLHGEAMRRLQGAGSPAETAAAIRQLELVAEEGHAPSQYELGRLHVAGRLVPRDPVKALALFRRAAEQGHGPAQTQVGHAFLLGLGGLASDPAQAVAWYEKAAAQGDPEAMFDLARLLEAGRGVEPAPRRAAVLYERAAALGWTRARAHLGIMHIEGRGVPRDLAKGQELLAAAARQEDPVALYRLALLRDSGVGGGRDPMAARRLLAHAADLGLVEAQVALARSYLALALGAPDLEQGLLWLEIAERHAETSAQRRQIAELRDAVRPRVEPTDLERARALARIWQPRPTSAAARHLDGGWSPSI